MPENAPPHDHHPPHPRVRRSRDALRVHGPRWLLEVGYAGSHGCLGMPYDDALWFWNWAEVGTALFIQE